MDESKPVVVVLLSTYNGSEHLKEQLDSIMSQTNVQVELYIRDDGSTDDSVQIAKKYTSNVIQGKNIGYVNSYINLIQTAPIAGFYALADQDDIWFPDKLSTAISNVRKQNNNKPILYACNRMELIEETIRKNSINKTYKNIGFTGFLNGYQLQACSMVFNYRLKEMIQRYTPSGLTCAQDTWLQQVCKVSNGIVVYDDEPHFLYRLGANNTLGLKKNRAFYRFVELFSPKKKSFSDLICSNLMSGYSDLMTEENKKVCQCVAGYRNNKFSILLHKKYFRGSFLQNILLYLQVIAGNA